MVRVKARPAIVSLFRTVTVGIGISPIHAVLYGLRTLTAGGVFHPASKLLSLYASVRFCQAAAALLKMLNRRYPTGFVPAFLHASSGTKPARTEPLCCIFPLFKRPTAKQPSNGPPGLPDGPDSF